MTAWRRVIALSIGEDDLAGLVSIARSRTEPASRVERARMLLAYRDDPSFFAVGRALGVHHQTVQRCVERALACGPLAALERWIEKDGSPSIELRIRRQPGWGRGGGRVGRIRRARLPAAHSEAQHHGKSRRLHG